MSDQAENVRDFWLNTVGPDGWNNPTDEQIMDMRSRFMPLWEQAKDGALTSWICRPESCLALVVLLDQFPRLMYRGSAMSYDSDAIALAVSKRAIVMGHDLKLREPERQFFYLPLMHSENMMDQERCVRLMCERMPEYGASNLLHARAHREVIRKFGRFPYRNEALHRATTEPEARFVSDGGYGQTVRELQAAG